MSASEAICEGVLGQLDMAINSRKSCRLRIGQRHNVSCAPLHTSSGELVSWVVEVCMGMGIPIPMGFPLDSHGNGSSFRATNGNGNGNGNGNIFNGNGNSIYR